MSAPVRTTAGNPDTRIPACDGFLERCSESVVANEWLRDAYLYWTVFQGTASLLSDDKDNGLSGFGFELPDTSDTGL